jgi:hypothetical protein
MEDVYVRYLTSHSQGRLATVGPDGARGGRASRYEVVRGGRARSRVAVAQIRRTALGADGEPPEPTADLSGPFSEMALYVLVRRGGTWWLAAGQNTPVLPPPRPA